MTTVLKCLQKYTEVPYEKVSKSVDGNESTKIVNKLINVLEKQKNQTPLMYYIESPARAYLQRSVVWFIFACGDLR